LLYCPQIWHPYQINDITLLERIQRRATKYILTDFTSNYKTRPINLNLLPLMYQLDLYNILFFIKSFQNITASFNIRNYVGFCQLSTRSSASNKLQHVFSSTNKQSNFYFSRLLRIYNSLPVLDLNQPFTRIKPYLKNFSGNTSQTISILMILTLYIPFARVPSAQIIHVHPISAPLTLVSFDVVYSQFGIL